ncbi:MAG: mandelate racemase/muconate lactonizing enzyme family protein [Gammaproteobacteria bacterium]|nr:mandelate racemase/muconate lactonizing enzyme family protein [Gammaproteobacteria bacterium]
MKLTSVAVYQVNLPFDGGVYQLSGGREWTGMDSTIVKLETDQGVVGWGETCPFGANYLQAFAEGARQGIAELAPSILGRDPSKPSQMYEVMDRNMLGHPYVKHAIDMACWDILGKLADVPLFSLLGGRRIDRVQSAGGIPLAAGELQTNKMALHRKNGCRQFSTKASGNAESDIELLIKLGEKLQPQESIKVDANRGWRVDEAIRVMHATSHIDLYFEQPCETYEECRAVHRAYGRPIILDECALTLDTVVQGWNEGVCNALNLKIGRVGGLTPALRIRNLCAALRIPFYIQCAGGNDLTQAAIVNLAHSSAPELVLGIWDIGDLCRFNTCENPLSREDGYMWANDAPGLGVEPSMATLGEPEMVFS